MAKVIAGRCGLLVTLHFEVTARFWEALPKVSKFLRILFDLAVFWIILVSLSFSGFTGVLFLGFRFLSLCLQCLFSLKVYILDSLHWGSIPFLINLASTKVGRK